MPQVISTNTLSLSTQNNLNKSQQSLNTAIERLSSGQRINSARDDAAGLAISNRMNAQIEGLTQANRNANDGISVAQTAEGALSQVTDNLTRIRELTVQSQNETLSQSDRTSIQDEINQRLEEIDRLSSDTEFNGKKLLNGDSDTIKIQVGANDNQTIDLNMVDIRTSSLKVDGFNVDGYTSTPTAATLSDKYDTNVTGTNTTFTDSNDASASGQTLVTDDSGNYFVKMGTGSSATYYAATVTISNGSENGTTTAPTASISYDSSKEVSSIIDSPLAKIDAALAKVDSARSTLGAQQNRLQSTIEGNATTSTNLSSAKSQITDADYATEVSNMTTAKILQQAGTSVLAQANQVPQGVLSLLQ